jgi:hypothetical protein
MLLLNACLRKKMTYTPFQQHHLRLCSDIQQAPGAEKLCISLSIKFDRYVAGTLVEAVIEFLNYASVTYVQEFVTVVPVVLIK